MLREKTKFLVALFRQYRLYNTGKAYISYGLSVVARKPYVWGYPPIVMIEPTNICNLRCPLCPSGNGTMKRPRGYMDFALFQQVIDQISPYTAMVILWNQGEPFLHKDIIPMIRHCKKKKMFVITSTNANFIPDPAGIVASGLDSLIISLDGASQETYNKYRLNGEIDKVLDNTKAIIAAKKKYGSATPIIKWQFIVMKHNENEIERIKKLARELEVDCLSLKTVQIYEESDISEFLPTNPKHRRYQIENDRFTLKKKIADKCRRIFTQPVINWDGQMAICCFDKDNEFKVGNVHEATFQSLWKGKRMNKVRQTILKNRKQIPICNNCGEGVNLTISKN